MRTGGVGGFIVAMLGRWQSRRLLTKSRTALAISRAQACSPPHQLERRTQQDVVPKEPVCITAHRTYASTTEKKPTIAVLGGGITGLATAYFLTQEFPNAKISLFESKEELGGWVKSDKINVGDGEVMFESGPRSLRPAPPAGTLALKLV